MEIKYQGEYPIVVAISGASGAIYAFRLLEIFDIGSVPTHLVISETARKIIDKELTKEQADFILNKLRAERHDPHSFESVIASGSYRTGGMVIIPSSMGTIGRIVNGTSDNLIVRAADVHLKEKRALIVVPREMPLGKTHLVNLLKLQNAGAVICPAMPSFYAQDMTLIGLADTVVARVLDHLNIKHNLDVRYNPSI